VAVLAIDMRSHQIEAALQARLRWFRFCHARNLARAMA
jgi:hypothetical protein